MEVLAWASVEVLAWLDLAHHMLGLLAHAACRPRVQTAVPLYAAASTAQRACMLPSSRRLLSLRSRVSTASSVSSAMQGGEAARMQSCREAGTGAFVIQIASED